jgi:hypothetical protein
VLFGRYIKLSIPEKLSRAVYELHRYVREKDGWNITPKKYYMLLENVSVVVLKALRN